MNTTLTGFACGIVSLFGLVAAGQTTTKPADDDVLARLRPGHPRVIVLDADIARIRTLLEKDADARSLRDNLRKRAEEMLTAPPIVHRLVGPRLLDQSRTCLNRVSTLAALYRLHGDRRYAERAEKEMLTAAAFPDWNPRHFLDTAEMTNALGLGYDWLFDVLPASSRTAIRTAIVEKGLRPGLEVYRKKNGWAVAHHNWNQVCNGGMTVGALAIADEEPAVAGEVISHARRSIPLAIATLAPDGGWPEGPGYWHYAMRYTAYYLSAVESALGTDFGLRAAPGFAETGLFRIHFISPANQVFNFADGGSGVGGSPEMFYFARCFDRPVYAAHERRFWTGREIFDLLWYDPRGGPKELDALPTDAFFRGINVVFLRSRWNDPNALFVGFKGGDNAANHSHLDLGTFVLDALGERWAIDLGGDDYNMPGYFGSQRWTYYRLRTEGQNTLVLGGENQQTKAKAPIVAFASSPGRSYAVADLSAAYSPRAQSVRRGVAMLDGRGVLIQDELNTPELVDFTWGMHTTAQVKIDGREAMLSLNGKKLHARIVEPASASWTVGEVKPAPPQRPLRDTRKLMVKSKTTVGDNRVVVLFSIDAVQASDPMAKVEPLADWPHRTR